MGRTKVWLEPEEKKLLEDLAKQDGVTIDIEFEAATLCFLKEHSPKLYNKAIEHASPGALEVIQRFEARKAEKDIAETKEFLETLKIEDGQWWIIKTLGFYAKLKDGKIRVPKEIVEKLGLDEGRFVNVTIEAA